MMCPDKEVLYDSFQIMPTWHGMLQLECIFNGQTITERCLGWNGDSWKQGFPNGHDLCNHLTLGPSFSGHSAALPHLVNVHGQTEVSQGKEGWQWPTYKALWRLQSVVLYCFSWGRFWKPFLAYKRVSFIMVFLGLMQKTFVVFIWCNNSKKDPTCFLSVTT